MKPITLTISTGRCGTTFLASTLTNSLGSQLQGSWVTHEHLDVPVTKPAKFHRAFHNNQYSEMVNEEIENLVTIWKKISLEYPVVDYGWTMRSLIPFFLDVFGAQIKVLHVHRHPVETAASFSTMGAYCDNSTRWALNPNHPRIINRSFKNRWEKMSPFEKNLFMWLEVNQNGLEVSNLTSNYLSVKSDDIFSNANTLKEIYDFSGFENINLNRDSNKNELNNFSLERRPIKSEWKNYKLHPEVIEFAEHLGYDMSEEAVYDKAKKYMLPNKLSSKIRHYSKYWIIKENAGRLLK